MQKSSWIALGIIAVLSGLLGISYLVSRPAPETITREQAVAMLSKMQDAVARKDVNSIMAAVSPKLEGKLADLNADQARVFLARAFRGSGKLSTQVSGITFEGGKDEATFGFDIRVQNAEGNMLSDHYQGRITLYLKRVEVSRLLGITKALEWRIIRADTTGPSLSSFGE